MSKLYNTQEDFASGIKKFLKNAMPNKAIRDYSHRFGGIECIFKNQNLMVFTLNLEIMHQVMHPLLCILFLVLVFFL